MPLTWLGLLPACSGALDAPVEGVELGPVQTCDAPESAFERFEDVAVARGLTHVYETDPTWGFAGITGGSVVARDMDGDGDIDLSFGNPRGFPWTYENDGTGKFALVPLQDRLFSDYREHVASHTLVDLDGDRLPELVLLSPGLVRVSPNYGGMQWGVLQTLWEAEESDYYVSAAFGDADGDGDLDLVLPAMERLSEATPTPGSGGYGDQALSPTPLLLNEGGVFTFSQHLGDPNYAILALFTDRDADGDMDILAPPDRGVIDLPPTAFFRNDGNSFIDDAADIGAQLRMEAMGIAPLDLDGNGTLDYCMSDIAAWRCLLGDADGHYWEGAAALGLVPPAHIDGSTWYGWSVEVVDLDNDGEVDAAATAAIPVEPSVSYRQSDGLWEGTADGFVDHSESSGFADDRQHVGMAAADLDDDGFLELVVGGTEGPPRLWQNRCGEGSWLAVRLQGDDGNTEGFGARVEVQTDARLRVRQIDPMRALGQGPPVAHFGLGDEELESLRVFWPDGQVSETGPLRGRRVVTITHPRRVQP